MTLKCILFSSHAGVFMVSITIILLQAGCAKETFVCGDNPQDAAITVTMNIPGIPKLNAYSLTVADECRVDKVAALIFHIDEAAGTEKLILFREIPASDITGTDGGITKTFRLNIPYDDTDYGKGQLSSARVVILANPGDMTWLRSGMSRQEIEETAIFAMPDNGWPTGSNEGAVEFVPFPMWGASDKTNIAGALNSHLIISMFRALVKIDVGINYNKATDTPQGLTGAKGNALFTISAVHIVNAANKASMTPYNDAGIIGRTYVDAPTIPIGTSYSSAFEFNITSAIYAHNMIYTAESEAGKTYLIIKGNYNSNGDSYYKVPFVGNNDVLLPLLRNWRYRVNISGVSGNGYATYAEAVTGDWSFNIATDLKVTDSSINYIVFNNIYFLGVSQETIVLEDGINEGSVAVLTSYTEGYHINCNDDWLTISGGNTGAQNHITMLEFSATPGTGENRTATILVTAGSLKKEIQIVQKGIVAPITEFANCYIINPHAETTVTQKIPLRQVQEIYAAEGLSWPTGNITATLVWKDVSGKIGNQAIGAENNFLKSIKIANGHDINLATLNVTVFPAKTGNAVVAIVIERKIRWSWHIWVTNYNPYHNIASNEAQTVNGQYEAGNGHVYRFNTTEGLSNLFMDRNLGAMGNTLGAPDAYGLLYQWGRLSPLRGATTTTTTEPVSYNGVTDLYTVSMSIFSGVASNLETALANPFAFYTGANNDWFTSTTSKKTDWWCKNDKSKGYYDPCPYGWRVPVFRNGNSNSNTIADSPWYNNTSSEAPAYYVSGSWTQGWNFTGNGYIPSFILGVYPAAGRRRESSGTLVSVTSYGSWWTATALTNYTSRFYLHITSGVVNPRRTVDSRYALSLRCVRD